MVPMGCKVTVIIPTYNRADLLDRSIGSVLNQTYQDYECIVVDDNSPGSGTERVVSSYDSEKLTYIQHEENRGSGAARNTGIRNATGSYLAFLDDDDEWFPEKLEKQVALFDTLPDEYGLVYCWMNYIDGDGRVSRKYRPRYRGYVFPQVLDGQRIGACSTLVVRRAVADDVGGFDESLPRGVDGDFIRRVCRTYKVDYVPETLVQYHTGHGHQRITRYDEEGLKNGIQAEHTRLRKFQDELNRNPRRLAHVFARLAFQYGELGEWDACAEYYLKAVQTSLVSPPVYVKLGRSLVSLMRSFLTRTIRNRDRSETS